MEMRLFLFLSKDVDVLQSAAPHFDTLMASTPVPAPHPSKERHTAAGNG